MKVENEKAEEEKKKTGSLSLSQASLGMGRHCFSGLASSPAYLPTKALPPWHETPSFPHPLLSFSLSLSIFGEATLLIATYYVCILLCLLLHCLFSVFVVFIVCGRLWNVTLRSCLCLFLAFVACIYYTGQHH